MFDNKLIPNNKRINTWRKNTPDYYDLIIYDFKY